VNLLTTRIEERSKPTIARNRFIAERDPATLAKYLAMQADIACDLMRASEWEGNMQAAVKAEAAAHWAFCLHPELRADDDTFWRDTYPTESERIHAENLARVTSDAYRRAVRGVGRKEKTIRRNVND
jgi:hypothetical protein